MASKTQEETRLTRYLLGELSEAERGRLEEAYFADDDSFEQMLAAEDELIDAYARGELSAEERRRFEERLLASPRGRERVQFARSLAGAVSDARPAETTPEATRTAPRALLAGLWARGLALRLALAAAALAVAVGPAWLLVERARLRAELRQLREENTALSEKAQETERRAAAEQARGAEMLARLEAEQARPTPEAVQQADAAVSQPRPPRAGGSTRGRVKKNDAVIARLAPGRKREDILLNTQDATLGSSSTVARQITQLPLEARNVESLLSSGRVSFNLTPGLARGGGANTLEVPGYATSILLKLNLERDSSHKTYRAAIETAEGGLVWHTDSVVSAGGTIELPAVSASALPPGDYVLTLSGRRPDGSLESVADYSFRVVRKTPR